MTLVDELNREGARLAARQTPAVQMRCAFPQQQAFVEDDASRFMAAFCTRRAAKSYSGGLKAFRAALRYPRCSVLIAGLHRLEVKRIWWQPILKHIDETHGLKCSFNGTELTATLPNGSTIYLLGMDANEKEKRKALGQKFPLVIIDEAQDWVTDVNALVFHVLKPALADYRGQVCLLGTPGLIAKGLFYDVTSGKEPGWTLHEWTSFDNLAPSSADAKRTCAQEWADEIRDLKAMKPGVESTPWFRRNYLREWVIDESALVYRFARGRNTFTVLPTLPRAGWHYVLGCDLGYTDPTAFVPVAFHEHDTTLYVLEAAKAPGMDVTSVSIRAKALDVRYSFDRMVIDNANKQAVEESRKRHGIPWHPADKTGKRDFIELMNTEFLTGRIKLQETACAPLIEEYEALIWDQESVKNGKPEEHAACANHCTDAGLYAWRYCWPYISEKPTPPPAEGTPEWEEAEERAEVEAAEAAEREARADAEWLP